ncbi:hypothetical protein GPALN_004610 [Globodera pallida]|nr:hypothetical protein GPALN_004610 [Globodera pallida]
MFQLLLKIKLFICIMIPLTLNGQKCNTTKCQKDSIATANDLLDSAQKAFFASDGKFSGEWLQKYIHDVLCCKTFEIKFKMNDFILEKNFLNAQKIQKDFCLELIKGKSIEKAAEKIGNMAIKFVEELANDKNIKKNIQKSLKANQNSLKLEETNVNVLKTESFKKFSNKNLNKLTSLFYLGLNEFFKSIKALKLEPFGLNGALASVDGRRRKRANFLENVFGKIQRFRENDDWKRTRCAFSVIVAVLSIVGMICSMLLLIINFDGIVAWVLFVLSLANFFYLSPVIKNDCPGFFNTNTSNTIQMSSVQP